MDYKELYESMLDYLKYLSEDIDLDIKESVDEITKAYYIGQKSIFDKVFSLDESMKESRKRN